MSRGIGPITFGVPQFEDVYGNKMDDLEWHAHVRDQLLGNDDPWGGKLGDIFNL